CLIQYVFLSGSDGTASTPIETLSVLDALPIFPMEGLTMRGNYAVDLKAKGVYDRLKNTIPAIEAAMSLANGYVKSSEFPIPMERSEEHTSELQSRENLVCRLLLEKENNTKEKI